MSEGLIGVLGGYARRVSAIDISGEVAGAASRRYPDAEVLVADLRSLPFDDARFDLVLSNSTLDHFESPDQIPIALRELRRVTGENGRLILTLDNPLNPAVALRNALPGRALRELRLAAYPTGPTLGPRGVRRLLAEAGFEPVRVEAIMHVPRLPAVVAARMIERRGEAAAELFLRRASTFERLGRLPSRYLSGHFVAAEAVARPGGAMTRSARP